MTERVIQKISHRANGVYIFRLALVDENLCKWSSLSPETQHTLLTNMQFQFLDTEGISRILYGLEKHIGPMSVERCARMVSNIIGFRVLGAFLE